MDIPVDHLTHEEREGMLRELPGMTPKGAISREKWGLRETKEEASVANESSKDFREPIRQAGDCGAVSCGRKFGLGVG